MRIVEKNHLRIEKETERLQNGEKRKRKETKKRKKNIE